MVKELEVNLLTKYRFYNNSFLILTSDSWVLNSYLIYPGRCLTVLELTCLLSDTCSPAACPAT